MLRAVPSSCIVPLVVASLLGLVVLPAFAGIPRDMVLAADEQSADEQSGTTIAKGHAEVSVEKRNIRGRADAIEVRPKIDEILLRGGANVHVGNREYRSDTISCTLDFNRCVVVDADQPLPASALFDAEMTPR